MKNLKSNDTNLKIRRIDGHYRFALDFFWDYGTEFFKNLRYANNENIEIIRVGFIGFGEYAYELLKVLCALGQLPRCRLIIYIFDKNADEKMRKFQKELLENRVNCAECCLTARKHVKESEHEVMTDIKYHDNPFYEIHFIKTDVEDNNFIESNCRNNKPFTNMFFLLGDDAKNIKISIDLIRAFSRLKQTLPKCYIMVRSDETTAYIKSSQSFNKTYTGIECIGADLERYDFNTILEDELEYLGRAVHWSYAFNKTLAEGIKCNETSSKIIYNALKGNYNYYNIYHQFSDDKCKENKRIKANIQKNCGSMILEKYKLIADACNNAVDEYNKKEYYRRSSKARALFEKLMFKLGYLEYQTKASCLEMGQVVVNNVVTEFGVKDDDWQLPNYQLDNSKFNQAYLPKNIPVYKSKLKCYIGTSSNLNEYPYLEYYKKLADETNLIYNNLNIDKDNLYRFDPHINVQWFEVNNIFQKRWMVFRWSEGYIKMDGDKNEEQDLSCKSHKFLMPYIEIYANQYYRIRHTLDVQIWGMANVYGIN